MNHTFKAEVHSTPDKLVLYASVFGYMPYFERKEGVCTIMKLASRTGDRAEVLIKPERPSPQPH